MLPTSLHLSVARTSDELTHLISATLVMILQQPMAWPTVMAAAIGTQTVIRLLDFGKTNLHC